MLDRVLNTYLETIPKTGCKILYVHVDVQIKCAVKCNYSWSVMKNDFFYLVVAHT